MQDGARERAVQGLRGGGPRSLRLSFDPSQLEREEGKPYPLPRNLRPPEPHPAENKTYELPPWTREGQQLLSLDEEPRWVDSDGEEGKVEVLYQQPAIIRDEREWIREVTPNIANARVWEAAQAGDDDEIRLMAGYLDADVNARDERTFNFTALHWAALHGHASLVPLLASLGADMNPEDSCGSTPLHYAADKGFPKVVEALVEHGAAVFAENFFGRMPLTWAEDSVSWYKVHPYSPNATEPMTLGRWQCIVLLRKYMQLPFPSDLLQTLGHEPLPGPGRNVNLKRNASALAHWPTSPTAKKLRPGQQQHFRGAASFAPPAAGPSGEDVEGPAPPGGESRGGDDGDPEPEWPSGGGDSGGGGSGGAEAEEEQEEEEESDSGLDQYKLT